MKQINFSLNPTSWLAPSLLVGLIVLNQAQVYAVEGQSEKMPEGTSEEARQLLEKMIESTRDLNYEGTFVYNRGNMLESMRIIHKVDEGGEVERLISMTGSAREVIRENEDVTCIYSDQRSVMVDKGAGDSKFLPSNLPGSIKQVSENYNFTITGNDRVAGRMTHIVEIIPKDEYRHIYRLWIDDESALALKSAIVNLQGNILETVLFTQINLLREIPSNLMTPMPATDYTWYTNEQPSAVDSPAVNEWEVEWMPKGFEVHESSVQTFSDGQNPVEHYVYTDGLASVSLYFEKVPKQQTAMNGYLSLGAVNAFTVNDDDYQVTVVGELPAQTVRKIAYSVNSSRQARKGQAAAVQVEKVQGIQ